MALMRTAESMLVLIDFQSRLQPAIADGISTVAQAVRLTTAAAALAVPVVLTEQCPDKLGTTVPELAPSAPAIAKASFDACGEPAFLDALAGDRDLIVTGWETHVCVGQTVLTLLENRRRVFVVQDAVGSRAPDSKAVALARMARHGAEIVTTEMVIFEWLRTASHPQFRELSKLIR